MTPAQKWELALLVSNEMHKAQLWPDVVTYNSAIAACNWDDVVAKRTWLAERFRGPLKSENVI